MFDELQKKYKEELAGALADIGYANFLLTSDFSETENIHKSDSASGECGFAGKGMGNQSYHAGQRSTGRSR